MPIFIHIIIGQSYFYITTNFKYWQFIPKKWVLVKNDIAKFFTITIPKKYIKISFGMFWLIVSFSLYIPGIFPAWMAADFYLQGLIYILRNDCLVVTWFLTSDLISTRRRSLSLKHDIFYVCLRSFLINSLFQKVRK